MANLIVTIISIALVAVAALMAAWYGVQPFVEGQSKATANTIIKNMEQIKAALIFQRTSSPQNSNDEWGAIGYVSTLNLTPTYLSEVPYPSKSVQSSGNGYRFTNTCASRIGLPTARRLVYLFKWC